ncbi:MAG: hypothetical protein HYX74_04820 [Acidobacteria bacterium]|nr:hypothetical protein [Acidobacteriota bacterium]
MNDMDAKFRTIALTIMVAWYVLSAVPLRAQGAAVGDCKSLIAPLSRVGGKTVGPEDCKISEGTIRSAYGVLYRRLEVGVSGTIEGYTPKAGTRSEMFTDAPEFALAQRGNLGPYYHGIGHYQAAKGSGMTLFLPQSAADWNGKLFILAHGSSSYPPVGELPPRKGEGYAQLTGANSYAALLVDKGYAVAYTRRPASGAIRPDGDGSDNSEEVHLDDGTVLRNKTFGYHLGLIRDWTEIARNLIQARFGRKPVRTYWYGKSGGASLGRIFNYKPGANRDGAGNRLYDGMLIDDAGGGWYWPVERFSREEIKEGVFALKPSERDSLVVDDAYRQTFAPQIDIAHQNYTGADHVQGEYLFVKRENARLLNQKQLGFKSRTYEIVGVSHADAGYASRSASASKPGLNNLDLSGLFDALIDTLDRWVEQGVEPAPTRSDAPFLGDVDGDGRIENSAVQLPEIACPTGVYYEYSKMAPQPGQTTFVPYLDQPRPPINADVEKLSPDFDPEWLEPLDRRGYVVDMNKNKVRDTRETLTQAWQRRWREGEKYGILRPGQNMTHEHYLSCVSRVASELFEQNLLSGKALLYYIGVALDSGIGRPAAEQVLRAPGATIAAEK